MKIHREELLHLNFLNLLFCAREIQHHIPLLFLMSNMHHDRSLNRGILLLRTLISSLSLYIFSNLNSKSSIIGFASSFLQYSSTSFSAVFLSSISTLNSMYLPILVPFILFKPRWLAPFSTAVP